MQDKLCEVISSVLGWLTGGTLFLLPFFILILYRILAEVYIGE